MKHLLSAALIATTLASPVKAEIQSVYSVQDFIDVCDTEQNMFLDEATRWFYLGSCWGVVSALTSMSSAQCLVGGPSILASDSFEISLGAARQAILNFANDHPEIWGDPVFSLALGLSQTWPCDG